MENKYLRALADYQNLKKDPEKNRRLRKFAAEVVLARLLPVRIR